MNQARIPNRSLLAALPLLGALLVVAPSASAAALDGESMVAMLEELDERMTAAGDFKALAYMLYKEKDKSDVASEVAVYRRDGDQKLMILFLKPKQEAGKGYLRIDDNLWLYDPNVGKWERRTERERIGGTDSRRADFDNWRLAETYDPAYLGEGTLGRFKVHKLKLTAKEGKDVPWPIIEIWLDQDTGNVLKRQEFALSGKLMRTSYFPKWKKYFSEKKKGDVWYAKEMRFYDEVEKDNSTVVVVKKIAFGALDANIFTKAWLESKSR